MKFKSLLKPETSAGASVATLGLVYGIYQLNIGSASQAQATDANHPVMESCRKKAGYTSLVAVAGLTLLTRDGNVGIAGSLAIIAMELTYRHSIMAHPLTGRLTPPDHSAYEPVDASMVPDYPPDDADADYSGYGNSFR